MQTKQRSCIFVIYLYNCSVPQLYNKWTNFHGVALTTFAKHLRASKSSKPEIMQVAPDDLLGTEVVMAWINLREDEVNDLHAYSVQHVVGNLYKILRGLHLIMKYKWKDVTWAGQRMFLEIVLLKNLGNIEITGPF